MSESYQAETFISLSDVHYAPLCPGERELSILGDVGGLRTLELACGAAQNSIALAKWGARATALDLSERQLARARELSAQEGVQVDLVQGDIERLAMFRERPIRHHHDLLWYGVSAGSWGLPSGVLPGAAWRRDACDGDSASADGVRVGC